MAETTAIAEPGITFLFSGESHAEALDDFMVDEKRKGWGGRPHISQFLPPLRSFI
jgi:hypothetical protein